VSRLIQILQCQTRRRRRRRHQPGCGGYTPSFELLPRNWQSFLLLGEAYKLNGANLELSRTQLTYKQLHRQPNPFQPLLSQWSKVPQPKGASNQLHAS
jgi:hypothetical protein